MSRRPPDARPAANVKHVVLRADRADGFVGRNFTMRGSKEFGFYTEETDGILLDRVKFFWAADYGHLSFTTDHNVIQNCEALGAGDAGVYPGASPETGAQATSFYPDAPRINTVVRKCDLHGNVLAYSGSMGNAVRITENEIYGNTAGISTDTISASGHPGFPADSVEIDHNNIYSNNLDLYGVENPPVPPIVGVLPVGVGIFWAGHNDGNVHDNHIFDNWRYGAQLLAVPDAAVALLDDFEPEGGVDPGISCPLPGQISTSCNNKFHDNNLGIPPDGFEPSPEVKRFGNVTGLPASVAPNGTDFWWDEFVANPGNCWFDNTGSDGTEGSVTGPGVGTPPDILPDESICGSYMGTSDSAKESNLVNCFTARSGGDKSLCDWYTMPPQPGTSAAKAYRRDAGRSRPGAGPEPRRAADRGQHRRARRARGRRTAAVTAGRRRSPARFGSAARRRAGDRVACARGLWWRRRAGRRADGRVQLDGGTRPVPRLDPARRGSAAGDDRRRPRPDQPPRRPGGDAVALRRGGVRALRSGLRTGIREGRPPLHRLQPGGRFLVASGALRRSDRPLRSALNSNSTKEPHEPHGNAVFSDSCALTRLRDGW